MKKFSSLFLVSLVSGAITLSAYKLLFDSNGYFSNNKNGLVTVASENYGRTVGLSAETVDFTEAADKTIHTVVHVKNVSRKSISNPILEYFYGYGGQQQQEQIGTGSGVIISEDGYIVTNNHVIKDATEIEITLNNKKSYTAKLIGTDSKMDIALLKINADEKLPYTVFANSDSVKVGEWVLAVGNPFNLESTVTAGIVSAKGRQNIIDRDGDINPLESFIQTDAAVNPGNSGGALVNLKGELIGINTAIYSRTGQFAGYSFAVPVSIVKKVSGDLIKYGNVQRGFLGVSISEVNAKLADEKDLKTKDGVYVGGFSENSAAKDAGIKINDVIVKIDGADTKSTAKLMEIVGRKRPGESLQVTINRDGQLKDFTVTLKNKDGNTSITKGDTGETYKSEFLGAKFGALSSSDKEKYRVSAGVKVVDVIPDGRLEMYGLSKGSIITKINDKAVNSPKEATELLEARKGRIKLEGIDVDGSRFIYVL